MYIDTLSVRREMRKSLPQPFSTLRNCGHLNYFSISDLANPALLMVEASQVVELHLHHHVFQGRYQTSSPSYRTNLLVSGLECRNTFRRFALVVLPTVAPPSASVRTGFLSCGMNLLPPAVPLEAAIPRSWLVVGRGIPWHHNSKLEFRGMDEYQREQGKK